MKSLRRWLGIEDPDHERSASLMDREIAEAKREYDRNLQMLEARKNSQAIGGMNSDRVMNTWAGAMKMLRDDE